MPALVFSLCFWVAAGGFGGDWKLERIASPPANDPASHWERFRNAPPPIQEEAALRVLPLLPDALSRRRFIEENFPDLARFGQAQGPRRAVSWLVADSCLLSFRLALWLEYLAQLPPGDRSWGYEILWDALPGHPQAFDFLRLAIDAAQRAGREQDARRLEKVQFLFWPLSFSEERRRELRQAIPCEKRKNFLQTALNTGAFAAVLESVADCPNPYWEALALYQKGEYAQAWQIWQQVPAKERTEKLDGRLSGMALSPDELIARYRLLHEREPSKDSLRRLVRTLLQFGKAHEAALALEGNSDPDWRFWRGLSTWMAGKRAQLSDWSMPAANETLEERTARLYWLARAGGPDELPQETDPKKPILAYYQYMRKRQKIKTAPVDGVTRGLAVILRKSKRNGGGLSAWLQAGALSEAAAGALALRPYDDARRTDECVLDLVAAARARGHLLLDLWKCPHFVAGRPQLCPFAPRTPSVARVPSVVLFEAISDAEDFTAGAFSGGLIPQPFEAWVRKSAEEFRLPKSLLWAVMQTESSFFSRVISKAGAVGLFQVIPSTGHEIARALGQDGFHAARLLVPETAVRFGAWYLRRLGDEFGENWVLVAAAYNAGPHQVHRWLKRANSWPTDAWVETIPFEETRRYVKLVVGRMVLFARQIGEPPPVVPSEIAPAQS